MSRGRDVQVRRNRLSRLLNRIFRSAEDSSAIRRHRGGRLILEGLEQRQLLAGDVDGGSTEPVMGPIDSRPEIVAASSSAGGSQLTAQTTPEGEPAPDLVQFAKDLDTAGVIFYGANWCPACTEQKQLFQDGGDDLPFVEVTNPDRSIGQIGIDNNITAYPTWVFPDNSRETGVLTLQQLSDRSGVSIPLSEEPIFEEIGDQTVLIGSPLHIPVDAYDPNGDPLTVTVSVSDPSLLDAELVTGNRSIRIDMETYGDMVFELFEQRAPRASGRVIELAQADFYDDIIFHRVIDDFVIQGGDPTGTGTGGSQLGDFDDDFHPDLQHNRGGILSYAKSSDDTNDSQFFVTEVPTRFLDFNHSVFGILVEGEDVREAISEHATNSADRPTTDIAINTVDVFTDTENSVIMLKPTGSGVGQTTVTVTVSDGDGNSFSENFLVDVSTDIANSQPFLNDVTVPDMFTPNTPATLQLSSTDVEGDAISYSVQVASTGTGATANIDQNGLLTVTPAQGFEGTVDVIATVRPGPGVTGNAASDSDNQRLTFNFEGEQVIAAPTAIDLRDSSDSGSSNSDNITNVGSLAFTIDGVTSGATVQLINVATNAVLGQAVATGTSVTITTNNIATLGDGTYTLAARQTLSNETSVLSPQLTITYDSTAPSSVIGSANTLANVDRLFTTDLISAEEGSITYALTSAPTGATINSGSGVIEWTPDSGDLGDNVFTIRTTDVAGNTLSEDLTVTVNEEPKVEVKLVARDLSGNEITSINVGDEFDLEFIGVDARNAFQRDGVFALYADILFDSSIIQPVSGGVIERIGDFTLSPNGVFSTGLIDELGAASTRTVASNEAESLIARVRFEAIASGSVNIRSEQADQSASEVLVYGEDDQIPPDDVFYGNVALTVGLNFALANDSVSIAEDSGATTINVLSNDTNNGSGTLAVVSVTQPTSGGTVTLNGGVVAFTPDANFNGSTEFTYRAGDGSGAQDTATVTVNVAAVNDPPTGNPDTFNVDSDSSSNRLDVLANDSSDPDGGETLTVTAVGSSAQGGTVAVASDNLAVNYTPASGFVGTDTFTYTLSDGTSTSTSTVTVTVAPADDPPTAVDDSFTVTEDSAEASFDVLQNDQRDGDNQDFVIDSVGTPSNGGSVRFSNDGLQFFYTPAANFFGTETATYTIRDTGGGLAVGTVTFTVTGVNDPPPVSSPTIPLTVGSPETVVLRIPDLPTNVDGSGETLTFTNLGTPTAGGTVTIDGNGNIAYTPPSDTFTGTDTFTYSVSDGNGSDSNGTVTVEVQDFTERSLFLQYNNADFLPLAASAVRISGTDALGNSVNKTAEVSENRLAFNNLLPGSYTVDVPAVPFFSGGDQPQQFTFNSGNDDGDEVINATMGRIKPEFLSIQDWLGSSPQQSMLVAVEPGSSAIIVSPNTNAANSIVRPSVQLNSAGTSLTINGQDNTDANITADVPTGNGNIVHPRGQIGNLRLYRVNVDEQVVNYQTTTVTAGSGEGEGVNGSGLTAGSGAEGEGVASIDVAPPPTNSDALGLTSTTTAEGEDAGQPATPEILQSESGSRRFFASGSNGAVSAGNASQPESDASEDQDDAADPLSAQSVDSFFSSRQL